MHHLNVDDIDHTSRAAESCQSSQTTMAFQVHYSFFNYLKHFSLFLHYKLY
ncbi:hypothetical protein HanXRQr2_Chr12g0533971 [Helianthus annuus]|uniref:Uncharacterized protein n=1 Tax=Helianthus annuus TaxID=4232 RepID=A0A251T0I0_HELAN|nr:hypothetical protein HanXRQr2_Chr12g0533971 [Helianthus annuus]KAJ0862101.1 hypothetical protein HanPSC8_Chr12g0514241 [Helianthus annuus]